MDGWMDGSDLLDLHVPRYVLVARDLHACLHVALCYVQINVDLDSTGRST